MDKEEKNAKRPNRGRADSQLVGPLKPNKKMLRQYEQYGDRSQQIQIGRQPRLQKDSAWKIPAQSTNLDRSWQRT